MSSRSGKVKRRLNFILRDQLFGARSQGGNSAVNGVLRVEHWYRQLPNVLMNITLVFTVRHHWPSQVRRDGCVEESADIICLLF